MVNLLSHARHLLLLLIVGILLFAASPASAQICATPGKDGSPGTITGVVNTYYPGTASVAANATSITIGAATGASTAITSGDLLIVIQMQDASINSSNDDSYGDGISGAPGSGYTFANGVGRYEFVKATNGVPISGGTLTLQGGGGGGLINAYTNDNAIATQGQRKFQVVRVPQYLSVTLSSGLTARAWNGSTGGILALDVAGDVSLNNSFVSVAGLGFRGGAGLRLQGSGSSNTDYHSTAPTSATTLTGFNGSKGEGIAGTPRYIWNAPTAAVVDTGVEGYPNGSMARGAPGNAGGGGTDGNATAANPSGNDENSGGGGGGNGGNGGNGGRTWNSNRGRGGSGGVLFTEAAADRLVMGGGGGAGTRNNDTAVAASGGAAGGGIVIIRAGAVVGLGFINASGAAAYNNTLNDGSGGGGAGGSVIVYVLSGSLSSLSVTASGGRGGDAWRTEAPNGDPGERHGPGGGGGGGVIFLSNPAASLNVTGGLNGITTTANDAFGATAGLVGKTSTNLTASQIPGVKAGALCPLSPTEVELVSYNATSRDNRVLLEWETGREVNNLGFNVYREQDGKRVRINKSLIVGSGLMASPGTVMTAGRSYAWQTSADQAKDSVYWVEEIDLSGFTVWHGPIVTQSSDARMSAREQTIADQTVTLSDMATESTHNGVTRPVETFATTAKPGAMKTTGAVINPLPQGDSTNPSVKISLKQEGWYRIGQPQLVAAGLNSSVNPNSLQLFADGAEVPISVITNNGNFDSTSLIEFYGQGLDTASTDTHVYSLVVGSNGLRIPNAQGQGGLPPSNSFLYTVERKDRSIYLTGVHNGDAENFFGTPVGAASVDQAITLKNVDPTAGGQATIEVGMQGFTSVPHSVTVSFNGSPIGTIQYSNQAQGVSQFQVPNSSLAEGQNLVTLASQAGGQDVSLVDHIRVSYWHSYAADGNALKFTASENQEVTLAGFTSADVKIFDVTNPLSPTTVAATVTSQKSSPDVVVTVAVPGTGIRTLLAIGDDQTRSPLSATPDKPSTWKSKLNAADLVIITHDTLKDSYKQLQALRQSQGLKVALVDVEDLYDEFNFGNKSPQAIKDFLAYARSNWKTAPKYVLLAGSASYDPKNYNGFGAFDLVPTKLIDTLITETASDDWFADFNLDGIAEMAVGRLPTPTSQEAESTVNKLAVYDRSPSLNSALLVADDNLNFDFEAANNSLAALFPGSITVHQINRGQLGTAAAKQQLLDGIASGQKIVNYVGHGSPSIWRDNLLNAADALGLTNTGRYPLFVAMTCLNGEFQHPQLNPLATALMNSREGGAIAVWASSGFTTPAEQAVMNQQFYTLLFQSNQPAKGKAAQTGLTLGEITNTAKAAVSNPDIRRTWILFGDPSMKVK